MPWPVAVSGIPAFIELVGPQLQHAVYGQRDRPAVGGVMRDRLSRLGAASCQSDTRGRGKPLRKTLSGFTRKANQTSDPIQSSVITAVSSAR